MHLSPSDVRRIAALARLALNDKEVEKFSVQLSDILSYAKTLEEVDTSGVEPVGQITGLRNVLSEDSAQPFPSVDALLEQSPQTVQDRLIRVKSVF